MMCWKAVQDLGINYFNFCLYSATLQDGNKAKLQGNMNVWYIYSRCIVYLLVFHLPERQIHKFESKEKNRQDKYKAIEWQHK